MSSPTKNHNSSEVIKGTFANRLVKYAAIIVRTVSTTAYPPKRIECTPWPGIPKRFEKGHLLIFIAMLVIENA